VIGHRTLDEKPPALKPLERGPSADDGAGQRLMSGLGRPGADERLEQLKVGNLSMFLHLPSFGVIAVADY
jgi:hypothetical protein